MTYAEYSNTPKGEELNRLFHDYQKDAMENKPGSWWATHCVTYAVMMELWGFLCDDEEFCIPDEAAAETAQDLFDRLLRWAHTATDVAIVLTIDHGGERFDCIKNAFSPVWKKVVVKDVPQKEPDVRQISLDLIAPENMDNEIIMAINTALGKMGKVAVVGGPQFTDARWTQKEYGL